MLHVLNLLLLVQYSSCLAVESSHKLQNISDTILCRGCGSAISTIDSIISKLSPIALYSYYDTVFNKDEILVQMLPNDFIVNFPVITSTNSTCLGVGQWQEDNSWFPGYHWKMCVCFECGAFIGWIFEPIEHSSIVNPNPLFALIPSSLVDESFTESLIKYPKI